MKSEAITGDDELLELILYKIWVLHFVQNNENNIRTYQVP
jgi:hypothetical protein